MKRHHFICSLLAASLLTTPLWNTQANGAAVFTDIEGSYAKDAIVRLQNEGIITGISDGRFNPAGQIKRQDFAMILAKALKLDISNVPSSPTFSDVPANSYAYASIEAVYQAGLLNGLGNGKFGSGQTLSRQDMVVTLMRAMGTDVTGKAASLTFKDSSSISDYAKDAVGAAQEAGFIVGDRNNKFNPVLQADRQAVALTASRFLQAIEEKLTTQPEPTPVPETEPESEPAPSPTPSTTTNSGGSSSGGSSGGGTIPSVPSDITAPSVNVNQIFFNDNYSGTQDQLWGEAGAVSEAGAVVKAYPWKDLNEDGKVDSNELNSAIVLGESLSDGSFAAGDIGDYPAGKYRFIMTATDKAGNETARDVASLLKIKLVHNEQPVLDVEAPMVDVSKFKVIDNYNDTFDQIEGDPGAVGEENAIVAFYKWTDLNGNNIVDEEELASPLLLGPSQADGSLPPTILLNLPPGDYRFVITAKDQAGNESPRDTAHVFTFTLVKGEAPVDIPTAASSHFGFDGKEDKTKYLQTEYQNLPFTLDYSLGEEFVDGTIEYSTDAFKFSVDDSYVINGVPYSIDDSQISNDGHTLKLDKLNSGTGTIVTLKLGNKMNDVRKQYDMFIRVDADGNGLAKSEYAEDRLIINFTIFG
ncbi:S-layer homology domain-containing protein [Paenibacillus illinoisensis]|uniref:S-layer homology domain-containing protein n=1 Tax=Paenibacillus illinoisensis TaxID=59845 RepID=UPI003D2C490D